MPGLQKQFNQFIATVGACLYRPNQKFLGQMLLGMLMRRLVLLSEVGRCLNERVPLIQTEKRLSRNLGSDRFDDAAVEQRYRDLVAPLLRDKRYPCPVIAVDTTDICKPRARKMPFLANVHDGSQNRVRPGWQVATVEAVGVRGRRLPLCWRLFSRVAPGYTSENDVVLSAVDAALPSVPEGCGCSIAGSSRVRFFASWTRDGFDGPFASR